MTSEHTLFKNLSKLALFVLSFCYGDATSLGLNIVLFEGLTFVFVIAAGWGMYMGFILTVLFLLI